MIAILKENEVRLLTGYDQTMVEVINPASGASQKLEKEQAEKMFEESGNLFFTYID